MAVANGRAFFAKRPRIHQEMPAIIPRAVVVRYRAACSRACAGASSFTQEIRLQISDIWGHESLLLFITLVGFVLANDSLSDL